MMQLWDTQVRANSARATPHKDQELIHTLELSLLACKNSFWSFAIRQRLHVLQLGMQILTRIAALNLVLDSIRFPISF